jgi:hypothetical protein
MAKWFYLADGQPAGPIDSATLKQLATTGRLKPTDKVRREDMVEWYEAKQVKGLFAPEQSQPMASPKTGAPTAAEPQSTRPLENAKRDSAKSNSTPAAASASTADSLAPTSNPPEKKKVKTRDAVLGCGCLVVLMVLLLPAIHAAREAARKNASGNGVAASANSGRGISPTQTTAHPNLTALDTSKLSPEASKIFEGNQNIGFASDSLADTALWAKTRCSQLEAASGNGLVLDEVRGAIRAEVNRLVGSKVQWELTVEYVGKKDIGFYRYAIKRIGNVAGTGDTITNYFQMRVYRHRSPDDLSLEDPHMPTDLNPEHARRLTSGGTVVVSADLINLELDSLNVIHATLANLTFAE